MRASKACGRTDDDGACPHLQPCPVHGRKPWEGASRRSLVSSRYRGEQGVKRAQTVLYLHDGICHVCGRPGADQADHVIPLSEGGPDEMDNLRPVHASPCHAQKTQAEAQRARAKARGRRT